MRLLTYNLWHGLSPGNSILFEALEPDERRFLRERLQMQVLTELNPDVCCFQEVNPAVKRVAEFHDVLRLHCQYQPDLVGIKLFGLGLPLNLNSGLVVAAKEPLKKIAGVSLSRPGLRLVHTWASWQLKEERFAIFCELMAPRFGRVLVVNTHLHHGLEETPAFAAELEALAKQLDLSEATVGDLRSRIAAGNLRRAQEMAVLLGEIKRHEKRYALVIVAGDFNASPESEFATGLKALGFRDSWEEGGGGQNGMTFDATRNPANHLMQAGFPLSVMVQDLSFDPNTKEALLKLMRRRENLPRRIDYIWVRSTAPGVRVKSAQLVGMPNEEGLAPSDHFGVCVDLERG